MKKQRFFMLGIITVLVAVLSLTFVSSTFAKYTSTIDGEDSARVAYWGINKDTSAEVVIDLFDDVYANDVDSNDGDNVIAPGTSKEVNVQFIYVDTTAPEVDYELTISTAGSTISDSIKNNTNITWSVGTQTGLTWQEFLDAIEDLGAAYEAGSVNNVNANLGWSWAIGTTDAEHELDTAMGNDAESLTVKLVITATATQLDR